MSAPRSGGSSASSLRRLPSLEDVGLAVGALTELRSGNGAASMFTLKRLLRRPERARDLLRFGDAAPDRGLLLTEEAKVAARLDDPQRALDLAQEAHELLAGHVRHAPNATHALAVAHAARGEIDVADAEFERAVTALAEREQWREAIYVARDWAETLRVAGREERAYAVLERATVYGQRVAAVQVPALSAGAELPEPEPEPEPELKPRRSRA